MFFYGKSLMVGCERMDDNSLKVYLGARWKGIYAVLPPGDEADEVEAAWGSSAHHVLIPTPPADSIFQEGGDA